MNIYLLNIEQLKAVSGGEIPEVKIPEPPKMSHPIGGRCSAAPGYLSIPDFKSCLNTKNLGSWDILCVPNKRPTACPESSWELIVSYKDPCRDEPLERC